MSNQSLHSWQLWISFGRYVEVGQPLPICHRYDALLRLDGQEESNDQVNASNILEYV
jgi:hypothetical protein